LAVAGQVLSLVKALGGEPLSVKEMMASLSLKGRNNFLKTYLVPAQKAGLIAMTLPDKPWSPKQEYLLTERGRAVLGLPR